MKNTINSAKRQLTHATDVVKQAWNENPAAVITAGATVIVASAKLLDSVSAAHGRRTWAKEVDRRVKNSNN